MHQTTLVRVHDGVKTGVLQMLRINHLLGMIHLVIAHARQEMNHFLLKLRIKKTVVLNGKQTNDIKQLEVDLAVY